MVECLGPAMQKKTHDDHIPASRHGAGRLLTVHSPPLSPLRRNHQKGNIITHASQGSEWHRLDKMHNPKTHNGAFANL